MDEVAYDKTPVRALISFIDHWPMLVRDLHRVTQPTIVFHAPGDNVVDRPDGRSCSRPTSARATSPTSRWPSSQHVATLDHDAPTIFERSAAFIERVRLDLDAPQKSAS